MKVRLLSALWLLSAALLAQPAVAQFLYKSTMPDGKVIYGDQPTPGAVKVEKTKPDTSKKGITAATPREAAALKRMEEERKGRTVIGDRTRALEDSLKELEAGREAAREPLEGERLGTAGGKSRLSDSYWERQKKLDQAIDDMRHELEKARAGK